MSSGGATVMGGIQRSFIPLPLGDSTDSSQARYRTPESTSRLGAGSPAIFRPQLPKGHGYDSSSPRHPGLAD